MKKPDSLKECAALKWDEMAPLYSDDAELFLKIFCENFSRYVEAEEVIKEKGMLYKNPSGLITPSPMVSLVITMQNQLKKNIETLEKYKIRKKSVAEPDGLEALLDKLKG